MASSPHDPPTRLARLSDDGWELESGEARQAAHPDTFLIPSREARENLKTGQAVKLLFRIEAQTEAGAMDLGVERMWAIVAGRLGEFFIGILENDPVTIDPDPTLKAGMELLFQPEHVIAIEALPREYLRRKFGARLCIEE